MVAEKAMEIGFESFEDLSKTLRKPVNRAYLAIRNKKGNNMVTKFVNQPLCMGISGAPMRKEWVLSAIGAGAGLLSSLIGGSAASKAAKKAARRQRAWEAKENAWYNRRYNEDYIDTAAGQNLVRRAKEYARENWKKAAGAQAVAGGTDAATAMAKNAGNKMVGDTIANIAAQDTARKAQVDNMHRQAEANFAQMDMNREMQRAQNITNAAQNASNAIMSAATAVDQASGKTPNLNGGSNNSTKAPASSSVGRDNGGKLYSPTGEVVYDPDDPLNWV